MPDEEEAQAAIAQVARAAEDAGFVTHWGKKVLEIRPPVRIDKGAGIVRLLRDADLAAALYVGDDMTDVDAFRGLDELRDTGGVEHAIKVGVTSDEGPPELEQRGRRHGRRHRRRPRAPPGAHRRARACGSATSCMPPSC